MEREIEESSPSSRMNRTRYLLIVFGSAVIVNLFFIFVPGQLTDKLYSVSNLLLALIYIGASSRRLHDIGKSNWWLLIFGWPVLNLYMFLAGGSNGINKYGAPP